MKDKISVEKIINAYGYVLKLKKLKRNGWLLMKIKDPESVADHIFAMCFLAILLIDEKKFDLKRILTQIIIHEICEAKVGDITPYDNYTLQEKSDMEKEAAYEILNELDESGELYSYWEEFELKKSKEGMITKDIDKLELVLQAFFYEKDIDVNLIEFYDNAKKSIENQEILEIVDSLLEKRKFA